MTSRKILRKYIVFLGPQEAFARIARNVPSIVEILTIIRSEHLEITANLLIF